MCLIRAYTCSAGVFSDGQGVPVIFWINGEQSNSEHGVLRKRCAVLKVLQIYAQLVVALNGESVDLFQT